MDLALNYNPTSREMDLSLAGGDLRHEDTLTTAVLLSLLSDRTALAHEVEAGEDRRGWWADAYATPVGDEFGSRLWLLERAKQLAPTVAAARAYVREALQWLVDDGLCTSLEVTGFIPRHGWLFVDARLELTAGSRRFRFEWSDDAQMWRLGGESFVAGGH